jgi:hypothetical protein
LYLLGDDDGLDGRDDDGVSDGVRPGRLSSPGVATPGLL